MINLTQLCYSTLGPISVVSECILLYGLLRLRQIREHPEIMIFWQCVSQLILDLHWFTGIEIFKAVLTDFECQFLGSVSMYFYFLSWNYTVLLSIEILMKILYPHETRYIKRRIWYHSVSHFTSLAVFIILMIGDNNGSSIMKTCFVENRSVYELVVILPIFIHFPLCIGITTYTICISYNTFYAQYLKYHMLVVFAFALCWVPISIVHGINYSGFHTTIPLWALIVNFYLDRSYAWRAFRLHSLHGKNVPKRFT